MIQRPPRSTRTDTLFPYTTLFRSEGIVAGGGVMLVRAAKVLDKLKGANDDQTVGIGILRRAITEPLRQIVKNAGEESSVVMNKVAEGKAAYGYNAGNGEYGDMIDMGIIDPAKRTEERRVGKECASTCISRGSPSHKNTKKKQQQPK